MPSPANIKAPNRFTRSTVKFGQYAKITLWAKPSFKTNPFRMKFLWFITFLLALVGMIAGDACPKGFKSQNDKCVSNRPVHGDCPKGSTYSAKLNLCVHN
uniref:Chitin-binding type-2 domain-containing protein n=1 Tax=Anopheles farauti TaxID=69004 RepID=A0A182Q5C6_9DIPT